MSEATHDKTVLLVEDNPDDAALALRALKKHNLRDLVSVARDGVEALEYLANAEVLPAVMLLDLKLPRLDGLEVLRRVRADQRTRLLPVVVLTSSDEARDLQLSYALGANSYIRKPVDYVAFTEAVGNLIRYWLQLNEQPPVG